MYTLTSEKCVWRVHRSYHQVMPAEITLSSPALSPKCQALHSCWHRQKREQEHSSPPVLPSPLSLRLPSLPPAATGVNNTVQPRLHLQTHQELSDGSSFLPTNCLITPQPLLFISLCFSSVSDRNITEKEIGREQFQYFKTHVNQRPESYLECLYWDNSALVWEMTL